MTTSQQTWICLDGGTTNTRATLMQNGVPVDSVSVATGVRNANDPMNLPVKMAIKTCLTTLQERHGFIAEKTPVLASGMLGSDAGLVNVPHHVAPVSLESSRADLYKHHDAQVWPAEITIVHGIKTVPATANASILENAAIADIMRGEEVQVWGLRHLMRETHTDQFSQPWLLLWPGSHTKLIAVGADGTIEGSFTTLAGELFAALKTGTLLRRSLPEAMPTDFPDEIVDQASDTVTEYGLLRAAFWTRVADLSGTLNEDQRAAWLSSAVIAADVQGVSRHRLLNQAGPVQIFIGGDSVRQSVYQRILARQTSIKATCIDPAICEHAAAIGASLVAGYIA